MRILHLTDLHFNNKAKLHLDRIISSLQSAINEESKKLPIDLVFFTGDLVYSGNEKIDFKAAQVDFIEPISQILGLDKNKFILCAGNHDMETNKEFRAITDYVNSFKDNDKLDEFVEKNDEQFKISCNNLKSFNEFLLEYYKDATSFIFHELFQIHNLTINKQKVGIVTFNTAWRSFIGNDSGKLLLPKYLILEAHNKIKDCEFKICLLHHDLSELAPYNLYEIEELIYELFEMKFSGHYHKRRQEAYITPDIGMLSIFSPATMSGNDNSRIGFSIIDIELDTLEGKLTNYDYIKSDNIFVNSSIIPANIPVGTKKKEQVEIIKSINQLFDKELLESNDLLVFEDNKAIQKNFLDLFSNPILKSKSKAQLLEGKKDKKSIDIGRNDSKNISIENIYFSNSIIYGKDKSGKTSLLRKVELDLLKDFAFIKKIPIFIDFKDSKIEKGKFEIINYIKILLNLSNSTIKTLSDNYSFILLVDNFLPDKQSHNKLIKDIFTKINVSNFLLTSEETLNSTFEQIELNKPICKLFIHPLTRAEIRLHTDKWLSENDITEKQEVIKKIENIFSQLSIPFNYWSLSLFLWLYKKEKNINIHDNIELFNLYVDGLLERTQLAVSSGNIDYNSFRSFLGEFAYELLKNHYSSNYCISYDDLVSFIKIYRERNILFVAETKELLDYLIQRGILKKQIRDSQYTFRLNGIMQYFLALHMKENKKFLDDVLNDEFYYLDFGNELELCAGFIKHDVDLLIKIRNRTESVLNSINSKYQGRNHDDILIEKITKVDELTKILSEIDVSEQKPIEYCEQDSFMDDIKPLDEFNEDVRVKVPIKSVEQLSHSELEKHLFILCRVFRSLTLVSDKIELNITLDFIVQSMINLGFKLLDEIKLDIDNSEKVNENFLLDIISTIIPLLVQMNLSEAMLQKSLKRLIEEKIDVLKKESKNEYKLFILYYMLLDIDLKTYSAKIPEIIETLKLYPLKNTSLLKLYSLLLFKANGDKHLQNILKEGITNQQISIKPNIDKSIARQQIDKQLNINKHLN